MVSVKNSSGEVITIKTTTDSSNEHRTHTVVETMTTAPFGSIGDATVAPGAQGNLLALQRSLLSQVASGITLQASTAQVGDVGLKARGTGGLSSLYLHSAATQNRTQVKTTSGTVYGWSLSNVSAAAFFKLYDSVSVTSSGTSAMTPKLTVRVPASGDRDYYNAHGIAFASGIGFALVTAGSTAASGAVGASDLDVNIYYA